MDVVAFVKFHLVFTSAMTGNIALLGISIGNGEFLLSTHSLAALFGFLTGAYIGSMLIRLQKNLSLILIVEVIILVIYAFLWINIGFISSGIYLYIFIILSSGSMGLQSVAARLINVASIPSVVFTNTITSIVIQVYEYIRVKDKLPIAALRQIYALLSYIFGATIFSWLLYSAPDAAVMLPSLIIIIIAVSEVVPHKAT